MNTFDPKLYRQTVAEYEETWRILDETLYRLCSDHPTHSNWAGVCAKVWIIGRTYTTQIERHVASDGTQGGSLTRVAERLHAKAAQVDALITELKSLSEPLTPETLTALTSLHGRFVRLLSQITRDNMSTRSFASKYLHFHHPVMPIYDSIAAVRLKKFGRWDKSFECFPIPKDGDDEFAWYLMRLLRVYRQVGEHRLPLKVKYVDNYVLSDSADNTA